MIYISMAGHIWVVCTYLPTYLDWLAGLMSLILKGQLVLGWLDWWSHHQKEWMERRTFFYKLPTTVWPKDEEYLKSKLKLN